MQYDKDTIQALLFEKAVGSISKDNDVYIEQLIEESDEVKKNWLDIQQKLMPPVSKDIEALPIQDKWANVSIQIKNHKVAQTHRMQKRNKRSVFLKVASIILLIGLGYLFWFQAGKKNTEKPLDEIVRIEKADGQQIHLSSAHSSTKDLASNGLLGNMWNTLIVPTKQSHQLTFEDGTEIWLNSVSKVQFPTHFEANQRQIHLEGEAFIKVSKDNNRPFIVHTPYGTIEVLGTRFNINAYTKETYTTSLLEGSIKSINASHTTLLKPGEQIIYPNDMPIVRMFDQQEVCSWIEGTYIFKNQSLAEITPVIERWFNVQVDADAAIKNKKFTGSIDKNLPLETVLEPLKIAGNLSIKTLGNKIFIN